MNKRVWVEEDWTIRQADIALLDRMKVIFGDGSLANGPGTKVHDMVAIVVNLGEELGHPRLSPVPAYYWEDVA